MKTSPKANATMVDLPNWTVRDLVESYPESMAILSPLGIDLCCGGAHRLGEALDLHGHDRSAVLAQIANLVGDPSTPSR